MNKERIRFLDGLKGFACFGVFTHHFFLSFFPASYFGTDAVVMTASGFDERLSVEPYAFFVNGNFWVCLFLVISAYLLSSRVFQLKNEADSYDKLSKMLLKRYIRLMIPAALTGIFSYILVEVLTRLNLNYLGKANLLTFPELLYHAIINMWIHVDSSVQGPFWMLHYLLFGSYLAILLALASPRRNPFTPLLHLFLAVVLGICNRYYAAIALGVMICWVQQYLSFEAALTDSSSTDTPVRKTLLEKTAGLLQTYPFLRLVSGILLLLAGLFFGAYPSYVLPDNIYRIFNVYALRDPDAYEVFHSIGAACLLISFFLLKRLAALFSAKPMLFLGKISFSIYLVHSMLLEHVGYFTLYTLNAAIRNYSAAGILTYIILSILLILLSLACYHTIERLGDLVCKKLFP